MDPFAAFKDAQRQGWSHFAPLEAITTPAAAQLVKHARLHPGQRVLDVACGTGVVAVTAARLGCRVTGLDLTPELLTRARENSQLAGVAIEWFEGDVERLPFEDAAFDAVLSQYGHMFAPRPEVAVREMLRVLKPGGVLAFATWPPEMCIGRSFALTASFLPPPPPGVPPPTLWGDPAVIRERLGSAVKDIAFKRAAIFAPALSPAHMRAQIERTAGPIVKLVQALQGTEPEKLEEFRRAYETLVAEFIEENQVRQDYLLTRATKAGA